MISKISAINSLFELLTTLKCTATKFGSLLQKSTIMW